jgi:hypothetical protein
LIRLCRGIAMISSPVAAVVVVIGGLMTPGYDPLSRTISRLAVPGMRAAGAIDAATYLVSLTCFALALALRGGAMVGRGALAASGIGFILAARFHLDPQSIDSTAVHWSASGIAILGLTVAPLALSRTYGRILLAAGAAEVAMLVAAVALLATSFDAWGAWERSLLALAMSWLVLLAARLRPIDLTTHSTDATASASTASLSSSGTYAPLSKVKTAKQ